MTERSLQEMQAGVTAMISRLKAAYPWRNLTPDEVRLYTEELCGYSADELDWAARTWVRTSERYPAISQILELVNQGRQRVPKWQAPQLPPGGLVTQEEARSALDGLVAKWGGSSRQRTPGEDDE